mmetsp:Transcript_8184/g.14809  ORF Transcript_8184/g.14809 Transcript_8184/m.14809 type:complete len:268 (-) Transcript_8184:677-1480(-)
MVSILLPRPVEQTGHAQARSDGLVGVLRPERVHLAIYHVHDRRAVRHGWKPSADLRQLFGGQMRRPEHLVPHHVILLSVHVFQHVSSVESLDFRRGGRHQETENLGVRRISPVGSYFHRFAIHRSMQYASSQPRILYYGHVIRNIFGRHVQCIPPREIIPQKPHITRVIREDAPVRAVKNSVLPIDQRQRRLILSVLLTVPPFLGQTRKHALNLSVVHFYPTLDESGHVPRPVGQGASPGRREVEWDGRIVVGMEGVEGDVLVDVGE